MTSGSAMSLPIPGATSTPSLSSCSMTGTMSSSPIGAVAALMQISPAVSGWSAPIRSVNAPPMLRPATTTLSERDARRR